MLTTLLVATLLRGSTFDFYADGPYDASIPRPESILSYGPGEKHTNFRDQERVIMAIAQAAKATVRIIQYGKTAEGRPLRVIAISSAKNMAHLDEIQQQHHLLAQGKGDASKTVPITWINECIHGDETASFETGMWTLYNLVASKNPRLTTALDKSVIMLNPVYNPDGHERYVVYYNSIAMGASDSGAFESYQPGTVYGRLNHYRFDMNRDRVAFSQDETRQEFAEMLKWGPQVYIDQHGQVGSYFFPPEPMSINPNVGRERNAKWTELYGRATGKAFDSLGLNYFVKDTFDLYYPGYLDASTTLSGAIGMTHETDGGRVLVQDRPDGSKVTLKQGVFKHFVSARAVVEATAENASALLADYAKFKKDAVSGASAGKFQRVVLTSKDERPLRRLSEQLGYAGITSFFAKPFKQPGAHDFWSGKVADTSFEDNVLVVDMAQPQGALAKALLEPGGQFEAEFIKAQVEKKKTAPEGEKYPGPDGSEFYDWTGWALPYAHGLKAWWCESTPPVELVEMKRKVGTLQVDSSVGYAIRYKDQEDILAVFQILQAGVRGSVTTKPMRLGGVDYPRGTFLFLAGHNEPGFGKVLCEIAGKRDVAVEPLTSSYPDNDRNSPGSDTTVTLKKPNIAVVMGNGVNLAQSGYIWYLMDRVFHLPFTAISSSALAGDLSKYTCIVFPSGASGSTGGKLRDWIAAGNCAVAFDGSWAVGSSGFTELSEVKGDPQSLPGALFKAEMDPRSFLSYGYEAPATGKIELAVPIQGGRFYTTRKEGGSIITLSNDEKVTKLLTGWAWPDDTEKNLRNTVFLQDSPVGGGHAILYFQDPTERVMWPGLYKTLLNGMIIGSSF